MKGEPAVIINAIVALVTEIIGLLVAFNVDVTDTQQTAIIGLVTTVATFIALAGPLIRQMVTPVDKAKAAVEEALQTDPVADPAKAASLRELNVSVINKI